MKQYETCSRNGFESTTLELDFEIVLPDGPNIDATFEFLMIWLRNGMNKWLQLLEEKFPEEQEAGSLVLMRQM